MTKNYAKQALRFEWSFEISTNEGTRKEAGKSLNRETAEKTLNSRIAWYSGKVAKSMGYKTVKVVSRSITEI